VGASCSSLEAVLLDLSQVVMDPYHEALLLASFLKGGPIP